MNYEADPSGAAAKARRVRLCRLHLVFMHGAVTCSHVIRGARRDGDGFDPPSKALCNYLWCNTGRALIARRLLKTAVEKPCSEWWVTCSVCETPFERLERLTVCWICV